MTFRVLLIPEAAKVARFAPRTLERKIARGEGPAVVHLSERRRGIFEHDLEAWLLARRHAPPGEQASKPAPQPPSDEQISAMVDGSRRYNAERVAARKATGQRDT